jgi:adenine phosphoribosyltransferase
MNLKQFITSVPNWPKPGVNFLDITPLLENPAAFDYCTEWLVDQIRNTGATSVVAVESRGFIFGSAAARLAQVPLVLVRKAGKLPGDVYNVTYDTEYSTDTLEIKTTANPGTDPLVIDDLLATGGTFIAVNNLLRQNFNVSTVSAASIINLAFLPGAVNLTNNNIAYVSLETYE